MNFDKHWQEKDGTMRLSLGNGLIKASVFFTSCVSKDTKERHKAVVNDASIGIYLTNDLAKKAVEENITNRVIKMLNQVAYGVK